MAFDQAVWSKDFKVPVYEDVKCEDGYGYTSKQVGERHVRATLEISNKSIYQMVRKAALSRRGQSVRGPFRIVIKGLLSGTTGSGS